MAKTPITGAFSKPAKNAAIFKGDELAVVMSGGKNFDKYIKAFKELESNATLTVLGVRIRKVFNQYVPKKSGKLRRSAEVWTENGMVAVRWGTGLPYAHYQYEGKIYDFNHVYFRNGVVAGWYSSPAPKKDSGRMMVPNFRTTLFTKGPSAFEMQNGKRVKVRNTGARRYIVRLGYSTPNTGHHWIEEITHNSQKYYMLKKNIGAYLFEQYAHLTGRKPTTHVSRQDWGI